MTSNLPGYRHIFYLSPTVLSQLAASDSSLLYWRSQIPFLNPEDKLYYHEFDYNNDDDAFEKRLQPYRQSTLYDYSPAFKMLDVFIKKTALNLDKWISFHRKRIFLDFHRYDVILKCLSYVIFNPLTANICYKRTAKKLLANCILNPDEKYRIACVYCLRDEIDILWPQVSEATRIGPPSDEFTVLSTSYWNRFKINEPIMNDLVEGRLPNMYPQNDVVWYDFIWPMCHSTDMYPLTKVQYFWSIFVSPERILMPSIIGSKQTPDVYMFLLQNLPIEYQKDLLIKLGHVIIPTLAEEGAQISYILQLWDLVKNSSRIRANGEFFVLIQRLWLMAYDGSTNCDPCVVTLLVQIWFRAPEYLRVGLFNSHIQVESFFDKLRGYEDYKITMMKTYKRDVIFFYDLLYRMRPEFRITLWFRNWRKFVRLAALPNFLTLAQLSLTEHVLDKFKMIDMMNFASMKNHFLSFLRAGFHRELNDYFVYCFSNQDYDQIRAIKRSMLDLIDEIPDFTQGFDLNRCLQFDRFIDSAFEEIEYSQRYKEEFIRRNFTLWLRQPIVKEHRFNEIINLTVSLIPFDTDLDQIKNKFYERCKTTLKSASFVRFHATEWNYFLKWCAPNRYVELKETLSVETIFLSLFNDVIRGRRVMKLLGPEEFYDKMRTGVISYPSYCTLEHFLWWYFKEEGVSYAKKFKRKMIRDCCRMEIKKVLMEESSVIVLDMLKWFFDNVNAEVVNYLYFLSTLDWFVDKYREISTLV